MSLVKAPDTATSNRSLCIKTLHTGVVEVTSYIAPNFTHQITYRDKAAPPTSWEQFILDPLVMQQFYKTIQQPFGGETLTIASNIRSFLDLPQLLPPSRQDPHPDPVRFQRSDHTFTLDTAPAQ